MARAEDRRVEEDVTLNATSKPQYNMLVQSPYSSSIASPYSFTYFPFSLLSS